MAEENPVTPITDAEPPKADPLASGAAATGSTLKLNPVVRKPLPGAAALKSGLKLPPKPGATVAALRPGLKLPPKPGTATQSALKSGIKLPPKPGSTVSALKPGINLPPRPQIRKPGEAPAAMTLPKPVTPAAAAPAPAAEELAKAPESAPETAAPAAPVAKVDQAGVTKLPTVEMQAVKRDEPLATPEPPKPIEALKSVTQKLKGITQPIPQQAILHKTGIIADTASSETQKEAAKHKTARISLAEAMGAAPVKNESAPMKTIRIKRPINIPTAAKGADVAKPDDASASPVAPAAEAPQAESPAASEPAPSVTQRKTLKIARPGTGAVRPSKFGIKRPASASAAETAPKSEGEEKPADSVGAIADIPEIADIPSASPAFASSAALAPAPVSSDGPAWLCALSAVVQLAACIAVGALAWYLFQDTQIATF